MSDVTPTFTRKQAEELSTAINVLVGRLQHRSSQDATLDPDDQHFQFWRDVASRLADAMDMQWMVPSPATYLLLDGTHPKDFIDS